VEQPRPHQQRAAAEQGRPRHGNGKRGDGEDSRRERRPKPHREGRRDDRDGDRRPREDRSRGELVHFSTEPPKAEKRKVADPDSPFAALAALKAQLEAKERGG
jgi:ATP-dependent RNA helicase SUPV3L1/SUV3